MGGKIISLWKLPHHVLSFSVILIILQVLSGCSLASRSGHVEQFLDSVEVCSATSAGSAKLGPLSDFIGSYTKKKIRLANFPNNTVIVKLTRWDQMWTSFYNFKCAFTVTAPKKMGIMMTIQSLHLRAGPGGSAGVCRDYIKFRQENDLWTSPVCGEVGPTETGEYPSKLIGRRFVTSTKQEMDVMFATQNETKFDHETGNPLAVEIVFTAFGECSSKALASDGVKPCSEIRKTSCIPKSLWCDGVYHCGFDDEFGSDESDCSGESRRENRELKRSMSMYVFAVSALVTLVVVVVCIMIGCCLIRKFQKPPRNAHFSRANMFDTELNMHTTGPPSAPPLTLERSPNSKSEDLPPPYDALFPTNEATDSGMKKK